MPTVVIDGVEYVPRAEVPALTDARLRAALQSLTEIQYFSEYRHKHRAWGWDALHALAPELAALAADNPQAAFERVRGEATECAAATAPCIGVRRCDEEHLQVFVRNELLATFSHDEHGWTGMADAERLVRKLAAALGLSVLDLPPDDARAD